MECDAKGRWQLVYLCPSPGCKGGVCVCTPGEQLCAQGACKVQDGTQECRENQTFTCKSGGWSSEPCGYTCEAGACLGGPKVIGRITLADFLPSTVAVVQSRHELLICGRNSDRILVYDVATLMPVGEIRLPGQTDNCYISLAERAGKLFVVFGVRSPKSMSTAIVDLASRAVIGVHERTQIWEVDENLGQAIGLSESFETRVVRIDTSSGTLLAPLELTGQVFSSGYDYNPKTHEFFIGHLHHERLDIVNVASGQIETVKGVDGYGALVDPAHNKVYGETKDFSSFWIFDRAAKTMRLMKKDIDGGLEFVSPITGRLYSTAEITRSALILTPSDDSVVKLLVDSSRPSAFLPGTANIYYVGTKFVAIYNEHKQAITRVFRPEGAKRTGSFDVSAAVHQASRRVFVSNTAENQFLTVFEDE